MGGKVGIHWERQKCKKKKTEEFTRGNRSIEETPILNLRKTRGEGDVRSRRIGTRSGERQAF